MPWIRLQNGDDDKTDTLVDDNPLTPIVCNDVLSRRQTVSALFASAVTLASTPSVAVSVDDDVKKTTSTRASSVGIAAAEPNSFQESLSGFVAGAALAGTKTLVKFPLDTATVRVQMPNSRYSITNPLALFDGCFNGISLTLVSNIPAGAVFFGVKDAAKSAIKNYNSSMPRWASTSLAVAAAMIPYWIIRNPSEVVKVRQQANIEGYGDGVSAIDAIQQTLNNNSNNETNVSDLYIGYWENVLYAYPADVIKFVAYDTLTKGRTDLSPIEGARVGAYATALAQLVTTPLDVVRNRLMTGKNNLGESLTEEEKKRGYLRSLVDLQREEGWTGLFAGATPRATKAFLSGAIQFATYEETKQSMSRMMLQRRWPTPTNAQHHHN
jgi:solute carrier family 25 S-adenosylmethionine transporter 26